MAALKVQVTLNEVKPLTGVFVLYDQSSAEASDVDLANDAQNRPIFDVSGFDGHLGSASDEEGRQRRTHRIIGIIASMS